MFQNPLSSALEDPVWKTAARSLCDMTDRQTVPDLHCTFSAQIFLNFQTVIVEDARYTQHDI